MTVTNWIVLLLFLIISSYGFLYEPNNVKVEDVRINIGELPSNLRGLRIVHISDLNFTKLGSREKKVKQLINKEIKPDLIVFTGDLFERPGIIKNKKIVEEGTDFLKLLSTRYGTFVVWGENEYNHKRYLKEIMTQKGLIILDDEARKIKINESILNLVGINEDPNSQDDYYADNSNLSEFLNSNMALDDRYVHFHGLNSFGWSNYEFLGKMRIEDPDDTIGVIFLSIYPQGKRLYYSVKSDSDNRNFHFTGEGIEIKSEILDTHIKPHLGDWYNFKIKTENMGKTNIKVKVWDEKDPEPERWQIDFSDSSGMGAKSGTIGVMASDREQINSHYNRLEIRRYVYGKRKDILLWKDYKDFLSEKGYWLTNKQIYDLLKKDRSARYRLFLARKINALTGQIQQSEFNILIAHNPDVILVAKNKGIDIVLSGHTHGGQIRLPILGALYTDTQIGRRFAAGLFKFSDTYLYINRGIGTSIIPFRFLCSPEVTLMTIS